MHTKLHAPVIPLIHNPQSTVPALTLTLFHCSHAWFPLGAKYPSSHVECGNISNVEAVAVRACVLL